MNKKNYVVTCKSCGGHSRITVINDQSVLYKDHVPIISARLRPDIQWGFECQCGNDSRLAYEEKQDIPVLVSKASPMTLERLAKNLTRNNADRFSMEPA